MQRIVTTLVAAVFATAAVAQPVGGPISRAVTAEDVRLSPLPPCTRAVSPREFRDPSVDVSAVRSSAIDQLAETLIAYNDANGSLRPAPGEVVVAEGEVAPRSALVRAPVTYTAVGRLQSDLIAAPVFASRFTVFPAGTAVWRRHTVVFYDCEAHAATFWCGRRSGPDAANRANLQCFIQPPETRIRGHVSDGIAEPHGPVFFPRGFTVFIEVPDGATPQVTIDDTVSAPELELTIVFLGWDGERPRVRATVVSDGVAAPLWDDVDMRRDPRGFVVLTWGGEILLRRGANDNAIVEMLTPVGPFSPEAVQRLMREKAELHVDRAITQAQERRR